MKKKKKLDTATKLLILFDFLIVLVSLCLSYIIRAQFSILIFDFLYASVLFPIIIILRLGANYFFDHYNRSILTLSNREMMKIVKHNLVPTIVILLLRLLSPLKILRMPVSMIFMEFLFTNFGFIFIRLIRHQRMVKNPSFTPGYCRRVLFLAENLECFEEGFISAFNEKNRCKIVGVLTVNPVFWDEEVDGILVYGDEKKIPDLVAENDMISTICISGRNDVSRTRINAILRYGHSFNLDMAIHENGNLVVLSREESKELLELHYGIDEF